MSSSPNVDAFADYLGITVTGTGGGNASATLEIDDRHLNPHGTAHGALLYSVVGSALAAAANDAEHSGVVSTVQIHYTSPGRPGDRLVATATLVERLPREDLFEIRLVRESDQQLVAYATGRANRRARPSLPS